MNKGVYVGDANHHFDVAIRQALGDLDLVEVFGCVVVNRGPQQAAQITYLVGRRKLRRTRADVCQLVPGLSRKIPLETVPPPDLPRNCLKIERRSPRLVHCAPLSKNMSE